MVRGYHNYRGRTRRQKRLLAVVLVLVILAAIAFLVVQNYIVYDDEGHAHIQLPFSRTDGEPDPQEPSLSDGDVNIDYIDNEYAPRLSALYAQTLPGSALRQEPEEALATLAGNAFVVEVKRVNGSIVYDTAVKVPGEVEVGDISTDALRALTDAGSYAVARLSAFCDSYFVRAYPDAALHWEGGDFWYDADGMAWLDPSHPQTLVYITTLCQELAQLGFDEIVLDYFSYPTTGDRSVIGGLEDTNRVEVLTDFVKSLRANLPEGTRLSIVLRSEAAEEFGLSSELLSQRFDRIYTTAAVDAEALRQTLPEKFDAETRLIPITATIPETGSYLLQ